MSRPAGNALWSYCALAAAVVWGGASLVGRVLVAGVDPLAAAWTRFAIAAAALAVCGLCPGIWALCLA